MDTETMFKQDMTAQHRKLSGSQVKRLHTQGAYGILLESVLPMIYGLAHKLKRRQRWTVEVLDLVQEASIGILERLPAWDYSRSGLVTFAYLVGRSRMLNYVSREARINSLTTYPEDHGVPTGLSQALTSEKIVDWLALNSGEFDSQINPEADIISAIDLIDKLGVLTERQRSVMAQYLEGHSMQAIGEANHTSKQAVSTLLAKGVDKLQGALV